MPEVRFVKSEYIEPDSLVAMDWKDPNLEWGTYELTDVLSSSRSSSLYVRESGEFLSLSPGLDDIPAAPNWKLGAGSGPGPGGESLREGTAYKLFEMGKDALEEPLYAGRGACGGEIVPL
jgi:hypothetical protein